MKNFDAKSYKTYAIEVFCHGLDDAKFSKF